MLIYFVSGLYTSKHACMFFPPKQCISEARVTGFTQ